MGFTSRLLSAALLAGAWLAAPAAAQNSTYYNPILPGWHSDPSCINVNNTFYCVTSTFISFPGLPIYASKDLINWKLISHVWNRESQLPGYSHATNGQQEGMYAATIRHNKGIFYVICEYLGAGRTPGVLFQTADPYTESTWTNAALFPAPKIDPDLFWDDDGKVYVATQGIQLEQMADTSNARMGTSNVTIWTGTGGVWPEGPHIYKKDGWYYLLIAEGGTGTDHAVTMARAKSVSGPYTAYARNPVLTNRKTQEYFQTVGHGDLFQDANKNWWSVALATRSGAQYKSYPMGRETVLVPVTWPTGEYPIFAPVRGRMSGWPLPAANRDIPGDGPFNGDPDVYDFPVGKPIPRNLVYWRVPRANAFSVTDKGLTIVPGRNALDGAAGGTSNRHISFIGRRQTDSLFTFSVDLSLTPSGNNQEAGVVAFLTQQANIQLGVVQLNGKLSLRFKTTASGSQAKTQAVPSAWAGKPIRLQVQMASATTYTLSAMLAADVSSKIVVGTASAELLSGGSGSFVGTLIGVYATCNGAGSGSDCPAGTPSAYFNRWRYTGAGQYISATETVPAVVDVKKSEV